MKNENYIEVGGGIYLIECIGGVEVEENEGIYETIILNKKGELICDISELADDFEHIWECYGHQIKEQFKKFNNII